MHSSPAMVKLYRINITQEPIRYRIKPRGKGQDMIIDVVSSQDRDKAVKVPGKANDCLFLIVRKVPSSSNDNSIFKTPGFEKRNNNHVPLTSGCSKFYIRLELFRAR